MSGTLLASDRPTPDYVLLELDEQGRFVRDGEAVTTEATAAFLARRLAVEEGVTDVFVWVHGWRTKEQGARESAERLFRGILDVHAAGRARYPNLKRFEPRFVAVRWPSWSWPLGYKKIRERAHAMTQSGHAEYALSSLLGYLDSARESPRPQGAPPVLQARGGYYLHCVGHSFGGRFLAEAIAASHQPSAPTLGLMQGSSPFEFTVDTFLVFQMAARPDFFEQRVQAFFGHAALRGPVCLTHSSRDKAVCKLHKSAEGVSGIGCLGAGRPAGKIGQIKLKPVAEPYLPSELGTPIVNVDAGHVYLSDRPVTGAHSDFWYQESIHLLLSLVDLNR